MGRFAQNKSYAKSGSKLSEGELQKLLGAVETLYTNGSKFGFNVGAYTPDVQHANMINLNNNPQVPTYSGIIDALRTYVESSETLQSFSEFMSVVDMVYKREEEYYANMLSFDCVPVPCFSNIGDGEDLDSKAFKDDERRAYRFLESFDYKREFRRVMKNLMRNGIYFSWFRTNGDYDKRWSVGEKTNKFTGEPKCTLQMMPQHYCQIANDSTLGLLYDFDITYFYDSTVDYRTWSPILIDKVANAYDDYVPGNPLNRRDGSFANYIQTSPEEGAWCFILDDSNYNAIPFLSPLLKDAFTDTELQKLQRNKSMIAAYGLLVGEMEMLKDQKSGQVKDAFAVDVDTMIMFLDLVRQGIGEGYKVGAMPLKDVEYYQYKDDDTDMYTRQTGTTAAQGVSASRVIYSTDKMSQAELYNSILTDYGIVRNVIPQFEKFLEYQINQKTVNYKFKVHMEGTNYIFERDSRIDNLLKMSDRGLNLSEGFYGAALGYEPHVFKAGLMQAKYGGIEDNLTQLLSIHTQSTKQSGGRPLQRNLTDAGSTAQEYDPSGGK